MAEEMIYELDEKRVWTGNSKVYNPKKGRKPNWIRAVPPALTGTQVAIWDGTKYFVRDSYPVDPVKVPEKISMRQARTVLFQHGILDLVEVEIVAISDPDLKKQVEIDWEYATDMWRSWEWIPVIAEALGLSQTDIDSLFIEAAQL